MSKTNPGGDAQRRADRAPEAAQRQGHHLDLRPAFRFEAAAAAAVAVVEAASAKKATPKSAARRPSPRPATPRRTPPARATRGTPARTPGGGLDAHLRNSIRKRREPINGEPSPSPQAAARGPLASPMPIAKPASFDDVAVARQNADSGARGDRREEGGGRRAVAEQMPTPLWRVLAAKKEATPEPAVPSTHSRSR